MTGSCWERTEESGEIQCPRPCRRRCRHQKVWYTGTMSAPGMLADSAAFTARVMMLWLHPFNSATTGVGVEALEVDVRVRGSGAPT